MRYPYTIQAITLLGILAGAGTAGVIRDDVNDALYQALGQENQFRAVGQLSITGPTGGAASCSGTVVANQWVLTAAHCVDRPASTAAFLRDASFGFVDRIIINPDWQRNNPLGGGDLALLRLSTPITGITPAQIYTGRDELGSEATIVGFGRTGTGLTGELPGTGGTLRAGNNIIDVLGAARGWDERILLTDFDNPTNPDDSNYGDSTPLDLEYSIAPGDSGGAMFILTDAGWQIAGISSFINSTDGSPNGDYGDSNGFTRVSDYAAWINSVIPTPGTLPMLAGGLMFGARRRRG